jgi:hypothetical protein
MEYRSLELLERIMPEKPPFLTVRAKRLIIWSLPSAVFAPTSLIMMFKVCYEEFPMAIGILGIVTFILTCWMGNLAFNLRKADTPEIQSSRGLYILRFIILQFPLVLISSFGTCSIGFIPHKH